MYAPMIYIHRFRIVYKIWRNNVKFKGEEKNMFYP